MKLRECNQMLMNKRIGRTKLQLFSEPEQSPEPGLEPEPDPNPEPSHEEKKYSDDDVDRIISKKFAEWQKKQERKVSEAEKLGNMTAEEKANQRLQELEKRIQKYEKDAAKSEMMKQARAILQDDGINVSDKLIERLVEDDAEATKSAVSEFASLFRAEVGKAVKEALKGEEPKTGGASALTKEQILAVKDRAERQRLIRENMNLFK